MIYTSRYESPLGGILLAGDQEGLTGLWFTEETEYFDQTKKWLDIYFSGRNPGFLPKIHLVGSDFRNRVGEIMCEIPYGKTVTYRWIADKIARERGLAGMSAQAVGGAVGHNPICIIVPCHRVVGTNGSLTGYGGGILRKKALLELFLSGKCTDFSVRSRQRQSAFLRPILYTASVSESSVLENFRSSGRFGTINFLLVTALASRVLLAYPVLDKMLETWHLTVLSAISSFPAISSYSNPSHISRLICR